MLTPRWPAHPVVQHGSTRSPQGTCRRAQKQGKAVRYPRGGRSAAGSRAHSRHCPRRSPRSASALLCRGAPCSWKESTNARHHKSLCSYQDGVPVASPAPLPPPARSLLSGCECPPAVRPTIAPCGKVPAPLPGRSKAPAACSGAPQYKLPSSGSAVSCWVMGGSAPEAAV